MIHRIVKTEMVDLFGNRLITSNSSCHFKQLIIYNRLFDIVHKQTTFLSQLITKIHAGLVVTHFTRVIQRPASKQHHVFVVQFPSRDLKMPLVLFASAQEKTNSSSRG